MGNGPVAFFCSPKHDTDEVLVNNIKRGSIFDSIFCDRSDADDERRDSGFLWLHELNEMTIFNLNSIFVQYASGKKLDDFVLVSRHTSCLQIKNNIDNFISVNQGLILSKSREVLGWRWQILNRILVDSDVSRWVCGLSGASQTTIAFVVRTKSTTNAAFALRGGAISYG
jgi:hypothetical protein